MAIKRRKSIRRMRKCFELDQQSLDIIAQFQRRYRASSQSETVRRVLEDLAVIYQHVDRGTTIQAAPERGPVIRLIMPGSPGL